MTKPEQHNPAVRMLSPPQPIPVFNCQVIVTPGKPGEPWSGRSANYAGLSVAGDSERVVLQQIVKELKTKATQSLASGEELTKIDPPESPQPGELVRWIAVHL